MEGLLALLKIVESLELKHRLKIKDGRIHPTAAFLSELATKIGSTVTGAYQAWAVATACESAITENERDRAELAFWYNVDPYRLTHSQRVGLRGNLYRMQAQSRLHHGNFDPTDYEGMYSMVLLATGDEQQAVRARGQAMEALINAKRGAR